MHINLLNAKRKQGPINTDFLPQGSNIDKQASITEVKVVGFSAEHNSNIAKTYSCGKTKACCILNRAKAPDLQSILIEQKKTSCYNIATDGSND